MKADDLIGMLNDGKTPLEILEELQAEQKREVKYNDEQMALYPHGSSRRRAHALAASKALERASAYSIAAMVVRSAEKWEKS